MGCRLTVLGVLLGILEWNRSVTCILLLWEYVIGYEGLFVACMVVEFSICFLATRGSILDTTARAPMQYILYIRLCECTKLMCLFTSIISATMFRWERRRKEDTFKIMWLKNDTSFKGVSIRFEKMDCIHLLIPMMQLEGTSERRFAVSVATGSILVDLFRRGNARAGSVSRVFPLRETTRIPCFCINLRGTEESTTRRRRSLQSFYSSA